MLIALGMVAKNTLQYFTHFWLRSSKSVQISLELLEGFNTITFQANHFENFIERNELIAFPFQEPLKVNHSMSLYTSLQWLGAWSGLNILGLASIPQCVTTYPINLSDWTLKMHLVEVIWMFLLVIQMILYYTWTNVKTHGWPTFDKLPLSFSVKKPWLCKQNVTSTM